MARTTLVPPRPSTMASARPPGAVASAAGRGARPWPSRPFDHERPAFVVAMRGENVRRLEGRTPTTSAWPPPASTRPPLVATAVASTRSDQEAEPSGRNSSCQNVFSGCLRSPIATVAHVPPLARTEVASGVGSGSAPAVPPTAAPEPWRSHRRSRRSRRIRALTTASRQWQLSGPKQRARRHLSWPVRLRPVFEVIFS